ncbi:PRKR interacting protein 1 (IL11 inducible)-like [Arapaima gigas]
MVALTQNRGSCVAQHLAVTRFFAYDLSKRRPVFWTVALDMASGKESSGRLGKSSGKEPQPLIITRTAAEEQRLKLERLMRNPDKPAPIPERPKEWTPRSAPEFVRDVMGSSAGAGSGEFHVYRHLRRREYQRQDFLDRMSEKQKLDEEYLEKVKENQHKAEERTAKRRKKREKLKQKKQMIKKSKQEQNKIQESEEESSSSNQEEVEHEAEDDAEVPSFLMGKR